MTKIPKSMCGDSYGCMTHHDDGTMGTELDHLASIFSEHICSRCQSMALDILRFMIGEDIEFVSVFDEWERKSRIQERLESMLLYKVLRPQLEFMAAMRSVA